MLKNTFILIVASIAAVIAQKESNLPLKAIAAIRGIDNNIVGNITFTQELNKVRVQGTIIGLNAGEYGFHIHEKGDISGGCLSTGGHFNPEHKNHGHPNDSDRHVGDLGNVVFGANQMSSIDLYDSMISLVGPHSILGRAVVLHSGTDDYGRKDDQGSKTTGNAGGRAACGVIGILTPDAKWSVSGTSSSSASSIIAPLLILAFAI